MATEILINVRPTETRVAYVENGVLSDFKIERKTSPTLVGSIHRGQVLRVLPGMQAAFVDIGLDRAAFLYVGDVRDDIDGQLSSVIGQDSQKDETIDLDEGVEQESAQVAIQDLLREGQTLLVQVAKDPLGTKGARITTHVSLPGRHIVFMPTIQHLGVSRKIEDEAERDRLRGIVQKLQPSGGVIVRTAGEGASEDSLRADYDYLERLWKEVRTNYDKRKRPGPIHLEMDVELRALRDLLNNQVDRVVVDDPNAFDRVNRFVSQFMPKFKNNIFLHDGDVPLFDLYDIDLEISRSMGRKIWLKSGGYIVIDEAEALVVIDVNTGRFVGKKNFEDTILKTNLEAAKEICHQLRIRNCGGIIIIDFIDMEKEGHREKVLGLLEEELQKDRARTNVVAMSDIGLVEMTRKRIRPSLIKTLCEPCSYCDGRGYIKQTGTVAHEIFREIERERKRPESGASTIVHCHPDVADWIYEEGGEMLEFVEKKIGHPIVFKVENDYHVEQYELLSL
jgi:ribonuclease G